MNRTMITATNTMSQLQLKIDLIGNNIANANTTGYKSKQGTFSELLVQQFNNQPKQNQEIGRMTSLGIHGGTGVRLGLIKVDLQQGSLKTTGRELDVALQREDLFFKIDVDGETQFTRDGSFYLSPSVQGGNQLQLVTSNGHYVLDENEQPIILTGNVTNVHIKDDGSIHFGTDIGGTQSYNLGMISVQNAQYLEQQGGNIVGLSPLYLEQGIAEETIFTHLVGDLRGEISLQQGALEASNVDISKEMTDLINVQRQYQFQARSVTMADQMLGLINSVR